MLENMCNGALQMLMQKIEVMIHLPENQMTNTDLDCSYSLHYPYLLSQIGEKQKKIEFSSHK
jgi:hypothetical protein